MTILVALLIWMASLTFQSLLKNRDLLPAEKFGKILTGDKESKRKLLSLISADSFIKNNLIYDLRVEISKWKFLNGIFFDFKKTSSRFMNFQLQ